MYTVFGFTDDCKDFHHTYDSFVEAVKIFRKLNEWCIVFMTRAGEPGSCQGIK